MPSHSWRAFVTASAPNGVNVGSLCEMLSEHAMAEISDYGPVTAAHMDEGKRWIEVCISFEKGSMKRDDAATFALLRAGRVFSKFGMTVHRVEVENA